MFTVLGNIFITPMLEVLGASKTVLPYASDYLSIVLYGAVFQCVAMCGNNFSRAQDVYKRQPLYNQALPNFPRGFLQEAHCLQL